MLDVRRLVIISLAVFLFGCTNASMEWGSLNFRLSSNRTELKRTQTLYRASGSVRPRSRPTLTKLYNGKILIAGGLDASSNTVNFAEVWDPITDTLTAVGDLVQARYDHSASPLMGSHKVIIFGGRATGSGMPLNTAEIFDPDTGGFSTFSMSANFPGLLLNARAGHKAVSYFNPTNQHNNILLIGGIGTPTDNMGVYSTTSPFITQVASVQALDIEAGTYSTVGTLAYAPSDFTASVLSTGHILVYGGRTVDATGFYSPLSNQCQYLAPNGVPINEGTCVPATGTVNHGAGVLNDSVYIFGGQGMSYPPLTVFQITPAPPASQLSGQPFQYATNTLPNKTRLDRNYPQVEVTPTGRFLIGGGWVMGSQADDRVEEYLPNSTDAEFIPTLLSTAVSFSSFARLSDGRIAIVGGNSTSGTSVGSIHVYESFQRATVSADSVGPVQYQVASPSTVGGTFFYGTNVTFLPNGVGWATIQASSGSQKSYESILVRDVLSSTP